MIEGWRAGVDEVHGVRHHRGGEGLALLARRLITHVEHPQQLRVGGEHAGVEAGGDLFGVLRHSRRRGSHDGAGLRGKEGRR